MKFKHKIKSILLDANQDKLEYEKGESINIILSPSLYWIKQISLPVKSLRDVNRLMPSIFEDLLIDGEYSYSAYKNGDKYILFAYESKKILDILDKHNINLSDVKGFYFAQFEFDEFEEPIKINHSKAIYKKENLLIITPIEWLDGAKEIDLSEYVCKSKAIKLDQYGHILDTTSLYKITILLLVFIVVIGSEVFITKKKISEIEALKSEVFTKYNLLPTMMQNRSILSSYKTTYEKQIKLREYISYFLKMPLKSNQKISLLDYKNGLLSVFIDKVTKSDELRLFKRFKSKNISYKISFQDKGAKVEIKI